MRQPHSLDRVVRCFRGRGARRAAGSGEVRDFLTNRRPGPASKVGGHGLERPIDVKFDRTGKVMYVLDFGIMTIPAVPAPERHTGVLWRVTRM